MKNKILKLQRIKLKISKLLKERFGNTNQIYFESRVDQYRQMWKDIAKDIDAEFSELTGEIWEIKLNGARTRIKNYQLEFDNPVTLELAGSKPLVYKLLEQNNIPIPDYLTFTIYELDKAKTFFKKYPDACVVKPADGYGGKGVTTHVQNNEELKKAAILASLYSSDLIIEKQIAGECYRLLILNGEMVHAVGRRGPKLVGDGTSTVQQLINNENEKIRSSNITLDIDRDCLFTLASQNLQLNSVPKEGNKFLVKSVNDPLRKQVEVRTVYNENVTNRVCDSIKRQAELSATIVNSQFLGVDVITPDITIPLEESGGVFNEVNTTPALHHHYDSTKEKYPQPALKAISSLLGLNNK